LRVETLTVDVPPNSAVRVTRIAGAELLGPPSTTYLFVHSRRGGFPSNRLFLAEIKDLVRPQPVFLVEQHPRSAHEVEVRLSTDQFIYFVKLECPVDGTRYSNNYLDLFPGVPVMVRVWNVLGRTISAADIVISTLAA
jgi:hypothetical protein